MTKNRRCPRAVDTQARRTELSAMHETLAEQVEALLTSEGWAAMLAGAAKLRGYSIGNLLLILTACPDAQAVMGYRAWLKHGRQVRKGERGIRILAPMPFTVEQEDAETGEVEKTKRLRFKAISVFEVRQTDPIDGAAEQATMTPVPLADESDPALFAAVAAHAETIGWTIERGTTGRPGVYGLATTDGSQRIVIDAGQSPADALATLIHEVAHVVLGHVEQAEAYRAHRGRFEVEAESVAYIVAAALGLDTSRFSVGYVAGWAGAGDEARTVVRDSAQRAIKAADAILSTVERDADDDDDEGEPASDPAAGVA